MSLLLDYNIVFDIVSYTGIVHSRLQAEKITADGIKFYILQNLKLWTLRQTVKSIELSGHRYPVAYIEFTQIHEVSVIIVGIPYAPC